MKQGFSVVDAWASAGICAWSDKAKVSGRLRRDKEGGEGVGKGQEEWKGGNRMRVLSSWARGRGKIGSMKGSPAGRKRGKGESGGFLGPRVDSRRRLTSVDSRGAEWILGNRLRTPIKLDWTVLNFSDATLQICKCSQPRKE